MRNYRETPVIIVRPLQLVGRRCSDEPLQQKAKYYGICMYSWRYRKYSRAPELKTLTANWPD